MITTKNLDSIRASVADLETMRVESEVVTSMNLLVSTEVLSWLVEQIDEAQANIEAAREHLQSVVSNQRYVGTRVQAEAERALELLDGEPDGADQ